MIITVTFEHQWSAAHADAADRFAALCRKTFQANAGIEHVDQFSCKVDLRTDASASTVETQIAKLLAPIVAPASVSDVCRITVSTGKGDLFDDSTLAALQALLNGEDAAKKTGESSPADPEKTEGTPADPGFAPPEPPTEESALAKIEALVGCRSFKELCREVHLRAPLIKKNHSAHIFLSEAYLVASDSGCGFDTACELFGQLLLEEGIFAECGTPHTFTLPAPTDNRLEEEMDSLFRKLPHAMEKSRVLAFDIADWTDDTNMAVFKEFLMQVFRKNKSCAIFFHVPYMGRNALEQLRAALDDIISTRLLPLEPFADDELRSLAEENFRAGGYTLAEDAWDTFDRLMDEEKRNGLFYGAHTVKKVSNEIISAMELHCARTGEMTTLIPDSVLTALLPAVLPEEDRGIELLRSMIGMEEIANRVQEIINQIIFARANSLGSTPAMHMCFVGNPGTGKTTVARVIGKALKDAGILRIGNFHEHHGRDFCGKYVGHTAPLTKSICEKAYGSILFVDEAYSLSAGSERDYGQEAVTTLIAEMENHKDDLVVIFAGYPEDIDQLLDSNSGMRSRVPYTLVFPNYTPQQLSAIYLQMAGRQFKLEDGFAAHIEAYFHSIPVSVLGSKSFGNARFVRNLYERTWGKAALRDSAVPIAELTLTAADFDAAAAEFPMEDTAVFKKHPVGFSL